MKNAHLRFGKLKFIKQARNTTTHIKLRMDRFIGESERPGAAFAPAHLISVIGGDSEVSAIWSAVSMDEYFTVSGPACDDVRVSLGRNASCFRGSILLPGRKRPLRHMIAVSHELAGTAEGASEGANRTILLRGEPVFILYRLATRFGLPVIQDWSEWFSNELQKQKLVRPLFGIGCCPVVIYGTKARFLSLISWGLKTGAIVFPSQSGPTCWTLSPDLRQLPLKCLLEDSGRVCTTVRAV